MDLGLEDRVVLVTGASSGIGAALAVAYGREGARVAVTYRTNRGGAVRTARAIEEAGSSAVIAPFDLAEPEGAGGVLEAVARRWDRIDILVANAVQWPDRSPDGRFENLARSSWQTGLRANIEGIFALVQAVVPPMREAGWGRILFMSTGLAEEGMRGSETYTAAKAALRGLVRSLVWDVGRDGILVNILAAGLTLTESNRARLPRPLVDRMATRLPLGRLSEPEELTGPALFLTSAASWSNRSSRSSTGSTRRRRTGSSRGS